MTEEQPQPRKYNRAKYEFNYDGTKYEFYKFYKSPDGEDCLEKTYYYTKYGGVLGAVFSFYEMALVSKPATLRASLVRFGTFTLPFAGMGTAFGVSLCLLGQMRKKTDIWNHFIAGGVAGGVLGVKFRSVSLGHHWGVVFAVLAAYCKYFDLHNLPKFTVRSRDEIKNLGSVDLTIPMYDDPGRPTTY